MTRPWPALTAAEKIEAVRPLEALGHAASIIAWKLQASRPEVTRICAFIRRERHAASDKNPDPTRKRERPQSSTARPSPAAAKEAGVPPASRLGAGRTAPATSEHGRDSRERPAPPSTTPPPPPRQENVRRLIDEHLAKNGARRFEMNACTDILALRFYASKHGFEVSVAHGRGKYMIRRMGSRGAARRVDHSGLFKFIDELRAKDGLEPLVARKEPAQ